MPKQIVTIIKEGRRGTGKKEPLKESQYEKYLRITAEKESREQKKSNRAIKRLKKEGKVQSISGFLVCKEEEEDDWMKSKLARFKEGGMLRKLPLDSEVPNGNKTNSKNTPTSDDDKEVEEEDASINSGDHLPDSLQYDNALSSDDNDDYIDDILNFRPFRHVMPSIKKRKRLRK